MPRRSLFLNEPYINEDWNGLGRSTLSYRPSWPQGGSFVSWDYLFVYNILHCKVAGRLNCISKAKLGIPQVHRDFAVEHCKPLKSHYKYVILLYTNWYILHIFNKFSSNFIHSTSKITLFYLPTNHHHSTSPFTLSYITSLTHISREPLSIKGEFV